MLAVAFGRLRQPGARCASRTPCKSRRGSCGRPQPRATSQVYRQPVKLVKTQRLVDQRLERIFNDNSVSARVRDRPRIQSVRSVGARGVDLVHALEDELGERRICDSAQENPVVGAGFYARAEKDRAHPRRGERRHRDRRGGRSGSGVSQDPEPAGGGSLGDQLLDRGE